jgi:hypothetical protein
MGTFLMWFQGDTFNVVQHLPFDTFTVTKNVILFGHVLAFVRFQFAHRICDVRSGHDCVALKHAVRFPASYILDDSLRNSCTPEIPRSSRNSRR